MPTREVSIAAATAVLGYDLFRDESDLKVSGGRRFIRSAGLGGSAAALDAAIELKAGSTVIGKLFNARTGMLNNDDMVPINEFIGPSVPLSAIVVDAPATNAINLRIAYDE